MNKVDMVRSIMDSHGIMRATAIEIVDGIFNDIEAACVANEAVKIPGFGIFRVRDRAARVGRNPQTGAPVKIPAKRVFKFVPAKALKEAVMSKKRSSAAAKKTTKKVAAKAPARKKAAPKKAAPKKVASNKAAPKTAAPPKNTRR
ncbi:MAG: hypothetical protein NVSMB31_15470 [Vulcanimicrobiaceae bacterium]